MAEPERWPGEILSAAELRRRALLVAADAEADVAKMDGQPFTGHTVATNLGYVRAQIHALGSIIAELATMLERHESDGR